ncbi:MAG: fumarylacetoacetate hydrolase [Odoribacter sp.]
MKILCAEYNREKEVAIVPVGDDVLLRNNGDFYIPEFSREVSCVPQLLVRICKLGKSVGERFAGRYFEEMGVGVRFYGDSFEEELRGKGLPIGMASSFDCSAAMSGLVSVADCREAVYVMSVNGVKVYEGSREGQAVGIERLVALSSDFHTMKIGDFLFCGGMFRYRGLKPDDRIQVCLNGKEMLDFRVK